MKKSVIGALGLGAIVLGTMLLPDQDTAPPEPSWMKYRTGRQPVVGLADADRLREQYETWKEVTAEPYLVQLFPSDRLARPASAGGWMHLDLEGGEIVSRVYGVGDGPLDLWLVDNADWPDNPAVPDAEDRFVRVGGYERAPGEPGEPDGGSLSVSVGDLVEEEFSIDMVVATPRGREPLDGELLLYGSPSLFQRLAALEERLAAQARPRSGGSGLLAFAFVAPQSGGVPTGFPNVFSDLVTRGEDLFFNETFQGNGRTCGTCHFAVNNFTIDAQLISSLPNTDPLFFAETLPPLIFGHPKNLDPITGRPRRFENPALMRAFGLIVENLDGFGDLENRFTMRGVPHNIGMTVSVERAMNDPGFPDFPEERTGWSGDGAPFKPLTCTDEAIGTLAPVVKGDTRSFAVGAVIQHFPKTLRRSFCAPDADFRLPTDSELNAFEAFFFGLGREAELNIQMGAANELILSNQDAEDGKVLFRNGEARETPGNVTCNSCHTNMGANPGGAGNANIDTGVEEFIQARLTNPTFHVLGEPRPFDGGFGLNPSGKFDVLMEQPGFTNENFGNGRFNTVSLVEAADSAPFFHAHVAFTVEESIDFYESPEFSPDLAGRIILNDAERAKVAAFMRAVNALDNIENLAGPRAQKAANAILLTNPNADDVVNFLLEVAIADTMDAIEVLNASNVNNTGGLPVNAVKQLERAVNRFTQAQNTQANDGVRLAKINDGLQNHANAVALIRLNP